MSTRRPVPVLAALAILLCAPVASGYSLRRSGAGVVLVWQQPRQQVEIDTSGLSGLPGAAAAVRAAFETWLAAGAPLELDFAPSAGKAPVAFDGRNVVTWESDWKYTEEVVAMTVSVHKASAASVTETDIVCNGRAGWVTAPGTGEVNLFDVQNVLTHEVGHLIGLGHEPSIPEATMYPYTPAGETRKRRLHADDLAGLDALVGEVALRSPPDVVTLPGCTMGGGGVAGAWVVLLPVLALIGCRRRWSLVVLLSVALLGGQAHASVVRSLSIQQMAATADVVVQARVVGQHVSWADGLVVTDHYLVVQQRYRGDRVDKIVLRTLGGQIGDLVLTVAGSPQLETGDTLVVFGRWQQATVVPIGLSMGLYRVVGSWAVRTAGGLQIWHGGRLRPMASQRVRLEQLERTIRAAARK